MVRSLCLASLAAISAASPIIVPRSDAPAYNYTNSFGLNFTQVNGSLPNVTIFATGMLKLTPASLVKSIVCMI